MKSYDIMLYLYNLTLQCINPNFGLNLLNNVHLRSNKSSNMYEMIYQFDHVKQLIVHVLVYINMKLTKHRTVKRSIVNHNRI